MKDDSYERLRDRAEALIGNEQQDFSSISRDEIKAIVHNLNVHQIELEMQNEELKAAHEALRVSERNFVHLFENAPVGYLRLDEFGAIYQSNLTFQTLLGYTANEINGKYLANFIFQEDLAMFSARYTAFHNRPENKVIELRMLHKTNKIIDVNFKGRVVDYNPFNKNKHHNGGNLLVNVVEIGYRKKIEEELKLAAKVFDNSEEGIMITDPDCKILKVNFSFTAVTGYDALEVYGKTPRILKSGRHGREFYSKMWQQITREGFWQGEIWNRRKNGDLYAEWLSITCVQDTYGKITQYIGIFSDITSRKQSEEKIEKLAHFDALTELPNRTLLQDRLKQGILQAMRHRSVLVVLFLDLDRFKSINDTLGHFVGDMLLQDVSKRLLSCVRASDTVARFGGDEFVIVLTDFEDEQSAILKSAEIAQKILSALSTPFELQDNRFVTSTSIGCALFPKDGNSVSNLIKHADTAMYFAKSQGRHNCQFFSPIMRDNSLQRSLLTTDLSQGLLEQQFEIFYQPKVDIQQGGKIVGLEALVRWHHPKKGLVSPEEFIPIAEESGIINQLGVWIMKTACAQLKVWHEAGYNDLIISINLSAQQFTQNSLIDTIKTVLRETDIDPHFLDLEITETVMMENLNNVTNVLKQLVRLGCTVSLDDFGTGYSSLTYLKKFPVHFIKIDRSFIRDIMTDPDNKVIVKSILAIAKQMRLSVIAEGIETETQAIYLVRQGCQFGQGYFYFKPMPAERLTELLTTNKY
jgi:diguanylate cyclase (GGDEF)-like protein/PAS domain S-box-containing protein